MSVYSWSADETQPYELAEYGEDPARIEDGEIIETCVECKGDGEIHGMLLGADRQWRCTTCAEDAAEMEIEAGAL